MNKNRTLLNYIYISIYVHTHKVNNSAAYTSIVLQTRHDTVIWCYRYFNRFLCRNNYLQQQSRVFFSSVYLSAGYSKSRGNFSQNLQKGQQPSDGSNKLDLKFTVVRFVLRWSVLAVWLSSYSMNPVNMLARSPNSAELWAPPLWTPSMSAYGSRPDWIMPDDGCRHCDIADDDCAAAAAMSPPAFHSAGHSAERMLYCAADAPSVA